MAKTVFFCPSDCPAVTFLTSLPRSSAAWSEGLRRSLRSPHHCASLCSLAVPPLPCRGWHGPRLPHHLPIDNNKKPLPHNRQSAPDQEWHNSDFVHKAETSYEQGSQLAKSLDRVSAVLALGGGTVMTPECAEMVREKTLCIYLRASVDTLVSHLEGESSGRPMLHANTPLRARIEDLMSLRSATYEKTAHVIIDTDGESVESVAQDISDHIV